MAKKPEECSVCDENYDEAGRRPRSLPCGHTFCSACITNTVVNDNLTCPSCRAQHSVTSTTLFPINFCVQEFVSTLKHTQVKSGNKMKLLSMAEEQKRSISSLITDCDEVLSQLGEYWGQLGDWKTRHHQLHQRLLELNTAKCELLEQEDTSVVNYTTQGEEKKNQLEAILLCLNTNTANTDQVDMISNIAEDWLHEGQQLFQDYNTVHTSMKVQEMISKALEMMTTETDATAATVHLADSTSTITAATVHLADSTSTITAATVHLADSTSTITERVSTITGGFYLEQLTVVDLHMMSETVKRLVEDGLVVAVQQDQDGCRSARITLQDGKLYLHPFLRQPMPALAHTLKESEVVGMLDPSCTLAFLDLGWAGSTRGRVTIRLTPDTPLARQFVLLCTGQRGHTYLNTKLLRVVDIDFPGECVEGGDYECNNGEGGASLLVDLRGQYRVSDKAGTVLCGGDGERTSVQGAQFIITTRDHSDGDQWVHVFGEVARGLDVVRAAASHRPITEVTVVDCGVVLPL